jgi:hypothetical protein
MPGTWDGTFHPYLSLANPEKFRGHRGHEKWPFGNEIGTAAISLTPLTPAAEVQCGRINREGCSGRGTCPGLELAAACEEGEVWFSLS